MPPVAISPIAEKIMTLRLRGVFDLADLELVFRGDVFVDLTDDRALVDFFVAMSPEYRS